MTMDKSPSCHYDCSKDEYIDEFNKYVRKVDAKKIPNPQERKIHIFREELDSSLQQMIKLSDQNSLLNNKLKETRKELTTVRRQCKIQDAKISKALDYDLGTSVVQRLTMDVQNLTLLYRDKTHKCDGLERTLAETKARLETANRHLNKLQEIVLDLRKGSHPSVKEHQRVCNEMASLTSQKADLEHRLKIFEKTSNQREHNWYEKVRLLQTEVKAKDHQIFKLKKIISDQKKQLDQNNIYSLRFRGNAISHRDSVAGSEHSSENDKNNNLEAKNLGSRNILECLIRQPNKPAESGDKSPKTKHNLPQKSNRYHGVQISDPTLITTIKYPSNASGDEESISKIEMQTQTNKDPNLSVKGKQDFKQSNEGPYGDTVWNFISVNNNSLAIDTSQPVPVDSNFVSIKFKSNDRKLDPFACLNTEDELQL